MNPERDSQNQRLLPRRHFLTKTAGGIGLAALAHLIDLDTRNSMSCLASPAHHLEPKPPGFLPKAKSVICLFQHGGPSQMDLFDHKPALDKYHDKDYPEGKLEIHFDKQAGKVMRSPYAFSPRGVSGLHLSELLPHTGQIVDDITLIRSMVTDSVDHESALRIIHGGKFQAGRPSWGAWVLYGLGSIRQELPAYVVLSDPGGLPVDGIRNWTSGWLPALYQGTQIRSKGTPVLNLKTPVEISPDRRTGQLELLAQLNREHFASRPGSSELEARIRNFEIAAQMQTSVGDALDLSDESVSVKKLYGLDHPNAATADYAKRCLLARRLVEKGVRFVQIYLSGQPWDTHDKNSERLKGLCEMTDQPSAALVLDLKQRGLLDSTIVLWCGEFGRLPISQGKDGRDHNRHAFSLWLAGGGFKRGLSYGTTDDFGYKARENPVKVADLHATLLASLGLDHVELSYPNEGRLDSLTDAGVTGARVVRELLG